MACNQKLNENLGMFVICFCDFAAECLDDAQASPFFGKRTLLNSKSYPTKYATHGRNEKLLDKSQPQMVVIIVLTSIQKRTEEFDQLIKALPEVADGFGCKVQNGFVHHLKAINSDL